MKNDKLVCGVGINDLPYQVRNKGLDGKYVTCPKYQKWYSMLSRCYLPSQLKRRSSYESSFVCDDWFYASNFISWLDSQDWEGNDLDKDLLIFGNQLYSPDTCLFIHPTVNKFLIDSPSKPRIHMIGAAWNADRGKFRALCHNPLTGIRERLGTFNTDLEAHLAWKARKIELARELVEKGYVTEERVAQALLTYYLNDFTKR